MATNQAYVLPDPKVEPFMGMKMRRSSSIARHLLGDYMQLGGNPAIHKLMSKQGDKTVLFADTVIKVNRQTKMQKRVLFVTEQALYLLEPVTYRIKRRVPLGAIEMLCLSEYSDNFFAVIIPSEYDYLLVSIHKTEIVSILLEATRKACDGQQPIVKIANKFECSMDSENLREVVFSQVPGVGISTKVFSKPRTSALSSSQHPSAT